MADNLSERELHHITEIMTSDIAGMMVDARIYMDDYGDNRVAAAVLAADILGSMPQWDAKELALRLAFAIVKLEDARRGHR